MKTGERKLVELLLAVIASSSIFALVSAAMLPGPARTPGRTTFETYCASCHGISGAGNGPAAVALRKAPANLTEYSIRNGGMFPAEKLRRIIDGRDVRAHGTSDMPVWGDAFKRSQEVLDEKAVDARISALLEYLESIQQHPAH